MANGSIREPEVKEFVLNNKHLFGDMGDTALVFEKRLSVSRKSNVPVSIADCLIFTTKKNIIGLEIKSEADTTKRLNRQLRAYSAICDYVYVLCHDTHVPEVERIVGRYGHSHVGIIAYTEFRGEVVAGVYREPLKSPQREARHVLNILWKTEILRLLGTFKYPLARAERELGVKQYPNPKGARDVHVSTYTNKSTKPQLIRNLIARIGPEESVRVVCDIFIHNRHDITKSIKLKHFFPSKLDWGG